LLTRFEKWLATQFNGISRDVLFCIFMRKNGHLERRKDVEP
jgi:hypothetical protein